MAATRWSADSRRASSAQKIGLAGVSQHPARALDRPVYSQEERSVSQVTPVLIPLPRAACKPWCARHDHSGGYCYSRDIPTPGGQWNAPGRIAMSSGPGGTLIEIHHDPDAELTPAEAEQFAHAILAQVRLA